LPEDAQRLRKRMVDAKLARPAAEGDNFGFIHIARYIIALAKKARSFFGIDQRGTDTLQIEEGWGERSQSAAASRRILRSNYRRVKLFGLFGHAGMPMSNVISIAKWRGHL
jgi:hypothetical protein